MSTCTLELILDAQTPRFQAGDTVHGRLRITPLKEFDAKELTLTLGWHTHGAGSSDRETVKVLQLDPPRWTPDTPQEIPFECMLPLAPLTHGGHLVNIDWLLKAELNLGWLRTESTELALLVVPDETQPRNIDRTSPHAIESLKQSGPLGGCIYALLPLVIGLFSGFTAFILLPPFDVESPFDPMFFLFVAGALVGLTVGALLILRAGLQKKQLGDVEVSVSADPGNDPNRIIVEFTHSVGRPLNVESIDLYLEYRERATSGDGTNKNTHSHSQPMTRLRVDSALTLLPGIPYQTSASLRLPKDRAPSFHSAHNEVAWVVGAEVHIKGMPTIVREHGLWVR